MDNSIQQLDTSLKVQTTIQRKILDQQAAVLKLVESATQDADGDGDERGRTNRPGTIDLLA
ncbi:MAG TPA: hypothetical protein VJ417_16615 [Candidatus Glassbacteria bacterium]|nr:hypothetical protein [Candidatus Glassbacteria bacterium]